MSVIQSDKSHLKSKAREAGWSIGKRDLCPQHSAVKTAPAVDKKSALTQRKLSKMQIAALERLQEHFDKVPDHGWLYPISAELNLNTLTSLVQRGLVEEYAKPGWATVYRITEAGRQQLAAAKAATP